MSFVGVAGVAIAGYGAYSQNQAGKKAQDAQNRALANSSTTLGDFSTNGTNGGGASYNQQTGQIEYGVGNLTGAQSALSRFAGAGVPNAGSGLPSNVQQAAQGVQNASGVNQGDLGLGSLDSLTGAAKQTFGNAQQSLQQAYQPFQQGLQNTAFAGAGQNLNSLNQTYGQVYDNTLGNLRTQAADVNNKAFAGLQNNQFATGRLGSTGGALQTEAFAKGIASADAGYQLQAQQQAQSAQQNQLQLAQGQAGIGSGLASQGDDLLNSAFNRFSSNSNLLSSLNAQRFQQSMYGNQTQYDRAQTNLGNQTNLAALPSQLQGAQLQNVLQALQGTGGIQQQGINDAQLGLNAAGTAANARIGAGSNAAAIAGSPSYGMNGAASGAALGQIGGSLISAGQNGTGGLLGRLFGGSGTTSQTPVAQQQNQLYTGGFYNG